MKKYWSFISIVLSGLLSFQTSAETLSEKLLSGAYFPESVSLDYLSGDLYVSSIATGEIVKVNQEAQTFVPPGVNNNSTGVMVDYFRGVLWSCNVDLINNSPSELRAFDLYTSDMVASYVIPDGGLCADIALRAFGRSLYITDTLLSRVLRLTTPSRFRAAGGKLTVWADDPVLVGDSEAFLKVNGIALKYRIFKPPVIYTTNYSTGTLYRIPIKRNGSAGKVSEVKTNIPLQFPDGIRMLGPHTLAVAQNIGSVVLVDIRGKQGDVTTLSDVLDQPTSLFPTYDGSLWVTEGQILRFVGADSTAPNMPFKLKKISLY